MDINFTQRKIIIAGLALIVAIVLFPPWVYTFKYKSTYSENSAGYSFIGTPPSSRSSRKTDGVKIDLPRLSIQVIAVVALTGIGLLAVGISRNGS